MSMDFLCLIICGSVISLFGILAIYDTEMRIGLGIVIAIMVIGWAFSHLRIK